MFDKIQPRLAMVTHIEYEQDLVNEVTAGVREHWDGLFAFGAPDVMVVNVTKDAIWIRDAALPGLAGSPRPNIAEMFPGGPDTMPDEMELPQPTRRKMVPIEMLALGKTRLTVDGRSGSGSRLFY